MPLHFEETPRSRSTSWSSARWTTTCTSLRCTQTGDAVLLDAANEHERLLELCKRLDVREVLETHGHWDHIQAVPAVRDAGYDVGVTEADAGMLPAYDYILEDETAIDVGRLRLHTIHTPGHTPGSMCFRLEGSPVLLQRATRCSPGARATPASRAATSTRSSARSTTACSRSSPADTIVMPGHGDDTTIGNERPHLQEWVDRGW